MKPISLRQGPILRSRRGTGGLINNHNTTEETLDESPQLLADNSILFVRMKQTSRRVKGKWYLTEHAGLERLSGGVVRTVANVGFTAGESQPLGFCNYYGHYLWPSLIAPAP